MKILKLASSGLVALALLSALSRPAASQPSPAIENPPDWYGPAPVPTRPSRLSQAGQILLDAPAIPIVLVKSGIDRVLTLIEKYHVVEKVEWFYDELKTRGIEPSIPALGTGPTLSGKVKFSREGFPFQPVDTTAWTAMSLKTDQDHGAEWRLHPPWATHTVLKAGGQYLDLVDEHFSGIGPSTRQGKRVSFEQEQVLTWAGIHQPFWNTMTVEGRVGYEHTSLTNGRDPDRLSIKRVYNKTTLPGLEGASLMTFDVDLSHDTRDAPDDPHTGGYEKVTAGYREGVRGSTEGYYRYQIEAARFFTLSRLGQVLALRVFGETNQEPGRDRIPFFKMARLGGNRPRTTLRGFTVNRYFDQSALLFNVEYRYPIWRFREAAMDAVLFWDEGGVFDEPHDVSWDHLEESLGFGFHAKLSRNVIFAIEAGFSDEGTRVSLKSGAAF